ncbi:hypothetical protein BTN50_0034 [Candidatus Enterovibrio altilux]|uniref:Uncharacterized protein n=1 Tax=Candidatus Enterovibrio altilux TaxID=1927128 RepID=A0A291B6F3_9GAMM|nr:hypothetical protein BTN50_0034 [Candidatus Enterovibrio luxaltus]
MTRNIAFFNRERLWQLTTKLRGRPSLQKIALFLGGMSETVRLIRTIS